MTAWAVQALLGSALLMAFVLAVRVAFVNFGGARAAYALWALPALRLLLPPLPAPVPASPVDVSLAVVAGAPAGEAWTGTSFAAVPWLWSLWLGGAALFVAWQSMSYRRFVRRALRDARPVGEVDGVPVLATPAVAGPVAIGPLRPRILVPTAFMGQPEAERALALAHEALHHKRGDLWANLLACLVLALHWFNPLAHLAHRAFRRDQELACDAAVIGAADAATRHQYGRALARAAGALPPVPATTLGEAASFKRRVAMLHRHKTRRSPLGALAVSVLTVAGLGLTATGGVAQTAVGEPNIEIKRIERHSTKPMTDAERESLITEQLLARCADGAQRVETQADTVQNGKPVTTRVILCGKDYKLALRPEFLQSTRESLSKLEGEGLSPETLVRIDAALAAAIAKARAGQQ